MAHNGGPKPNRKKNNPARKERRRRHYSRLFAKKLRRVRKHNGEAQAEAYAKKHAQSFVKVAS